MKTYLLHVSTGIATILLALAIPAIAHADILGTWKTGAKNGSWGYIKFYRCGTRYCGRLVGGGGRKVNRKLFGTLIVKRMRRKGRSYSGGQILDADAGQWYLSKMRLIGKNRLQVQGCVLGGLICGGQNWSRR